MVVWTRLSTIFLRTLNKALILKQYFVAEITFGTPEYDEAVRLRYDILRRPLGLFFNPEDFALEYEQMHIGCYDHRNVLAGYLNLTPLNDSEVKMRQVAVAEHAQKSGIGRQMVDYAEKLATRKGFEYMVLNARETAVPFYDKLAYERVGERFEEVGIPHFKMKKRLS